MSGADDRLLCVVQLPAGYDKASVLDVARFAAEFASTVSDHLLVVFQPPSALHHHADGSVDRNPQFNPQIKQVRELLLQINRLGLPTACELGDTITPQFFADLLSWACVSAQSDRLCELVSGLSMPVGLRAPAAPDGSDEQGQVACDAINEAGQPKAFLGVTSHGTAGIVQCTGNPDCSVVLGGGTGSAEDRVSRILDGCADLQAAVIAECGGAGMSPSGQAEMAAAMIKAVAEGRPSPAGLSLSSFLLSGALVDGGPRVHGMSVTEPCLDWIATEVAIRSLAAAVRARRVGDMMTHGDTQASKRKRQ